MRSLALAVASISLCHDPRAVVPLSAPPAAVVEVAAALGVVVDSQSRLDFGSVAADTTRWGTAGNLAALPVGFHFPGLGWAWARTLG